MDAKKRKKPVRKPPSRQYVLQKAKRNGGNSVIGIDGLNDRERKFCRYYVKCGKVKESMRAAGWSPGYLHHGTEIMARPEVQAEIERLQKRMRDRLDISVERVLREIASIAFARITDVIEWDERGLTRVVPSDELEDADIAAISEVVHTQGASPSLRVKMHDKDGAILKLCKQLGICTDRVDVTSGGKPLEQAQVIFYIPENGRDAPNTEDRPAAGTADAISGDAG